MQVMTAASCCYTTVPYQLLQPKKNYIPPSTDQAALMQMQIGSPFKCEHSSFRASENNRFCLGDGERAIRAAKLCLRDNEVCFQTHQS